MTTKKERATTTRIDKYATLTSQEREVMLRAIAHATLGWALDELARNPSAADGLLDDDEDTKKGQQS